MKTLPLFLLLLLFVAPTAAAQENVSIYAAGLNSPLGMTFDADGNLWVAEQGTGNNDGRISVVTPDGQVHAVIEGLPSESFGDETTGPTDVLFDADGNLLMLQGQGSDAISMSLLTFDMGGFTPGDAPRSADDAASVENISDFAVSNPGVAESNPYRAVWGPGGDLFIVDAAANAIFRRASGSGELSLFAQFPDLPNPTPVGPPFFNTVPTGIAFTGDQFLVSSLTGFPFLPKAATVYAVDLQGNVSVYQDGLTLLTDLAVDPVDGTPAVSMIANFDLASGFIPGTGSVTKLYADGSKETLAGGLNFASSLTFSDNGDLFIGSLFGMILRVAPTPAERIGKLAAVVAGYEADGQISPNLASILKARLGAAQQRALADDTNGTIRTLRSVIGFVSLVSEDHALGIPGLSPRALFGGRIPGVVAQAIIDQANQILAGLGATPSASEQERRPALQALVDETPASFRLDQNYPNPFNPSTTIRFSLPEAAHVRLTIYNALGQEVATLVDGAMNAGVQEITWNSRSDAGSFVPSGVYLYRMEAGATVQTRTMQLIK